MSEELQRVIDRGILFEDSDGLLWMTEKAKGIVNRINNDEVLMALIKKKAIDEEDAKIGFWTMVFKACCETATKEEVREGVRVLLGWRLGVKETRLDEWSMGLRFR